MVVSPEKNKIKDKYAAVCTAVVRVWHKVKDIRETLNKWYSKLMDKQNSTKSSGKLLI